jgi:hypothetical protein
MKNLDDILKIVAGYQVSKVLFAAVEFEIFTAISGTGKTIEELSAELKLPKRSLFRLLGVCTACGVIEKKGVKYFNSEAAERYLVKGKQEYVGDFCKANNKFLYNSWGKLEDIIKSDTYHPVFGDKGDTIETVAVNPEIVKVSHRAQHNYSLVPAKELAEKFDFSSYNHLIDLGGGSGILSVMAAKKFTHLRATVFDFEPVCRIAKEIIAEHGVTDRLKTHPGNILKDDFPQGGDAIMISGVLDGYGEKDCRLLIKKAYDYLPEGGVILIKEALIDDDRTGPLFPAIFSLALMIETKDGDARAKGEMSEWLMSAGFSDLNLIPLHDASGSFRALGILSAKKR